VCNREWVVVVERIVPNRDAVVLNLILVKERMREFVAKPEAFINNKNECLTTVLTSVSSRSSDDRDVLFTFALICIVGGDIANTSSVGKGYKIRAKCTGVGMSIEFTPTENRINR
jgi:hypothetical protein